MKEFFAIVASILAIIGYFPYVRDTYSGRIEPHAYSWLVWALVSGITLGGQIVKGAGIGALSTGFACAFSLLIFFYSLRFGVKHITRMDTVFLVVALLALVPWAFTNDPTLSVMIAVGIDIAAFVPTIRKTWRSPKTESSFLYVMNATRHVFALFSLEAYNIATALHSIAMVAANTLMTALLVLRNRTKKAA